MHESPIRPYGGMGQVTSEVCKRLKEKYDLTVFGYDIENRASGIAKHDGYKVVLAESTNNMWNHDRQLAAIITEDVMTDNIFMFLKNTKFDLIHLCDSFLYKTAKHLSIRDKCPIVNTAHLSFTLSRGIVNCFKDPQDLYAFNQEAHTYIHASHVTTVSENYKRSLLEYFPQLNEKITVIPNGVDFDAYQNKDKGFTKNHCKTEKKIIGFVGRCTDTKGIDWVCSAVRMFPEHHFLVISSWNDRNYSAASKLLNDTEKTCKNMTWEKSIRVFDPLKINLMAGCDLALMPSRHEPWGITANEWQAMGVPLIATPEVQSVIPGTYTMVRNEQEMLQAIRNLNKTKTTVKSAIDYAKSLNWDSICQRYTEVFDQCLTKYTNSTRPKSKTQSPTTKSQLSK